MTIYYIAPGHAYSVVMTEEMPEYSSALARMQAFFEEHPTCHMVNYTGRLNGQYGSYVCYG